MREKTQVIPNWSDPATTAENEVLPRHLKWSWTSRAVSAAVGAMMIMQVTYYATDVLGLGPVLVGVLLLASKIFDGFTDLIAGYIVDRTKTKFGKARPYEIFIVFQWLFTIVMFSAPDWSTTGKAIFLFVMYTLICSVCSTMLSSVDAVYLARSVRSERNRVSVLSFSGAVMMLVSIVFGIIMPMLIKNVGTSRRGWIIMTAAIGIPMALIGILRFFFVKEVAADNSKTKDTSPALPLKTGIRCILRNRFVWILAGMDFVVMLSINLGSAVNTYY